MTFRVPGPRGGGGRQVQLPRWPRFVIPAVIIIVALAVLIAIVAGIWTDYLWYSSVHQTRVFGTTYTTKWLLFLVTAVFMGGVVGANLVIAYRLRPEDPPTGPGHQGIEAYRQAIDPHRRGVMIVLLGLIGLITGLAAASNWRTWLLFINRVPFGRKDPQFNLDISFYVFVYPFLRMLLSFLFAAVLLALVLSAAVHVLYGGLRISRRARPSRGARTQLFVLAGVFVALQGGRLLGGQVRDQLLPAWRRADRGVLHRRQCRAAGQDRARRDRRDLRGAAPGRSVPAQRAGAGNRLRAARAVGRPDRRRISVHHSAVRGQAEPAGQGAALHQPRDRAAPGPRTTWPVRGSSPIRRRRRSPAPRLPRRRPRCPTSGSRIRTCSSTDVPAAAAGQGLLPVRRRARDGPVHLRPESGPAGHRGGCPGYGRAAQPARSTGSART